MLEIALICGFGTVLLGFICLAHKSRQDEIADREAAENAERNFDHLAALRLTQQHANDVGRDEHNGAETMRHGNGA